MTADATVYIIDDNEDARALLAELVSSMGLQPQTFASGEEFLASPTRSRPGCVLTDLRMPGINGLELQAQLARENCPLPVILVSAHVVVDTSVQAMRSGAVTVIEKPFQAQQLWEAIGEAVEKDVREHALQTRAQQLRTMFGTVSDDEFQVLELVSKGIPNKSVAARLAVSVRTVEDRRRRIMQKLQTGSFAELMEIIVEARNLEII